MPTVCCRFAKIIGCKMWFYILKALLGFVFRLSALWYCLQGTKVRIRWICKWRGPFFCLVAVRGHWVVWVTACLHANWSMHVRACRICAGWVWGQRKESFRWNKSITAVVKRSAVNLYQTSGDHPVLQISEVLSRHALMALIYGLQDSLKRSIP